MKASYKKYILNFKNPSGTSRGILRTKETWFLILEENGRFGIGECGIFRGLSMDDVPDYEDRLRWLVSNINKEKGILLRSLQKYPSIQFGLEQALLSLSAQNPFELFPSNFIASKHPIEINGLVWMGDIEFMKVQVQQKLEQGFRCIKMKIGAIDFNAEVALLTSIRNNFDKDKIELRVDANGAFSPGEALEKLNILSQLDLHSIEQPIRQGQWQDMKLLCQETPLPIALDEELIGITDGVEKRDLLQQIRPQYIILKPSLVGGFQGSEQWIAIAKELNIGWWVTSALESNIGLNAIAQWTATLKNPLPQGLGTGGLFTNNFDSPLTVSNGGIFYDQAKSWKANLIKDLCL
ncbi:o-succinylbenzoate synthase [Maribacter chungangensis]|uniref:O-succinylbenzoate synthase n=1 Tax=Maribacter chungangensis TaxID=1069117 RepID=A0ABW3B454_9FLAO